MADAKPGVLREWLEQNSTDPADHDFVLYTDGSGCVNGWGAYAAMYEEMAGDDNRTVTNRDLRIGGTYGYTVQRCEMTAMLDGVHAIVSRVLARSAAEDDKLHLSDLVLDRRVTICWFTDRLNIARSLLFGESGMPLDARLKERDLWLRYSAFAKHVCVTPRPMPRNDVVAQEKMDALCGIARESIKARALEMAIVMTPLIDITQWNKPKSQKASL